MSDVNNHMVRYHVHFELWKKVDTFANALGGISKDSVLSCFTTGDDLRAATGLDWVASQFETEPGLINNLSRLSLLCERALGPIPNDEGAAKKMRKLWKETEDRLLWRAIVRLLERNELEMAKRLAANRFDVARIDDWLKKTVMHRALFPVYRGESSYLVRAEVYRGQVADPLFSAGAHLAHWSFHWLMNGDNDLSFLQVKPGESLQVSLQPLRPTDFFDRDGYDRRAAASSFIAPIMIQHGSFQFAVTLAARREIGNKTLRPVIATGLIQKDDVWSIEGLKLKLDAVNAFWKMGGHARWFVYPLKQGGETFEGMNERCKPVNLIDNQLDKLLTDGFDSYRDYLLSREFGLSGGCMHLKVFLQGRLVSTRMRFLDLSSVSQTYIPEQLEEAYPLAPRGKKFEDLLKTYAQPIIENFDADPHLYAECIFNEFKALLLSQIRSDVKGLERWDALAELADDYVVVLCGLEDLPKDGTSLTDHLARKVGKQMNGQYPDPPLREHFEQKIADKRLVLVVYPKRSLKFLMDETITQLKKLKELEETENKVILVCPNAHLRWVYDNLDKLESM